MNEMKKRILFLSALLIAVTCGAMAQSQKGFVKTRGRIVNGKVVAGQGLTGATVHVKGRASVLVKNSNGSFSFPVTTKQFVIESVNKKGYQLVDADAAPKTYVHSPAPIYLVMETPSQLMEDKLEAERKLRRTLTKRLQQREDELEALKEQNRITQEQYNATMQQLYDQQESNEALVREMAEYYSRIDYDQIDEFNTRVSEFILAGDLAKADSLLRSKGDIDERIRKLNEHHNANVQARETLEKSEQAEQFSREDLAQDCFSFFRRFALDNKPDSALCYIEKRAALDSTNCQWQADAGSYLQKRGMTRQARKYYDRALKAARKMAADNPELYEPLLAKTLNNIALLYTQTADVAAAEPLFQESLALFKRLSSTDESTYSPYVASTLNNMAVLYSGNIDNAGRVEQLLQETLSIYMSQDNVETFSPAVASIWNNLALLYDETGRYEDSEQMYLKALDLYGQLGQNTRAYDADYAATLNNLSALYFKDGSRLFDSHELLVEALDIYRRLAAVDAQQYSPLLAVALNNLSVQEFAMNHKEQGEQAFMESLDIYRAMVKDSPRSYLPILAKGLYDQAIRYYQNDDMEKSEALFQESLDAYRTLGSLNGNTYLPEVAKLLRNLATVCDKRQQWDKAGKMYEEELSINQTLASSFPGEYTSHVARTYGNLSNHAILIKDFDKAIEYARQGLALDESRLFIQANLAAALLFKGEQEPAMAIYRKYKKELRDTFLDDFRQFEALGIIPQEAQQAVKTIKQFINQ
ncbi:MAG: tetratricopeptide repeat protein [Bacteroidales bacterium]|nr:tetratricopeptide repeat protein [Bacteroidales bacterium]